MKTVFCTTCKGRTNHIERTLPKNLKDNPNATFVLVDYNSQDHLSTYLAEKHMEDMIFGRLVVYSYRGQHPFRMAHAKNMAHRCAMLEGADIMVNLDADNFTGPGFADYVADYFGYEKEIAGNDVFLWAKMVKDGEGRLPKGISGRIAVSRYAFLNAGGYDEKYETWSPDDKDFTARLRRLGYDPREIDPRFLQAILHTNKLRFREYRHAEETTLCEEAFHKDIYESTATVVNFGNIGCGTVFRNFDFSAPIELKPVPTRIFGIGMHKTGTTSLHTALVILGFDSAHWKSARWAKRIWQEMSNGGSSRTLERSYALCDLPIPLMYQELDEVYPGSKFILTVRDEVKWIESVRNHWDHEKNPFRAKWNDDPFTHKAHKLLYGQKGFDAELFLNRYRRHNAEVFDYFERRGRMDDLCILDMGTENAWPELCRFLGKPLPDVPYPVAFKTEGR
jgi:hypothetical protein